MYIADNINPYLDEIGNLKQRCQELANAQNKTNIDTSKLALQIEHIADTINKTNMALKENSDKFADTINKTNATIKENSDKFTQTLERMTDKYNNKLDVMNNEYGVLRLASEKTAGKLSHYIMMISTMAVGVWGGYKVFIVPQLESLYQTIENVRNISEKANLDNAHQDEKLNILMFEKNGVK